MRLKAIDDVLNDIERVELAKFADNPTLYEAVKKVILFNVYFNGTMAAGEPTNPLRNYSLSKVANSTGMSNEQVGADMRAIWEAVNMLEGGYQTLLDYKTPDEQPEPKNLDPH